MLHHKRITLPNVCMHFLNSVEVKMFKTDDANSYTSGVEVQDSKQVIKKSKGLPRSQVKIVQLGCRLRCFFLRQQEGSKMS